MKFKNDTSIFFLILVLILLIQNTHSKLRHLHFLFRHGDRSPIAAYPNDHNDEHKTWPEGFGALTKLGEKQHFRLGQFFRQHYANFLTMEYHLKNLLVRSTDIDRTLQSALSHLSGLYYPFDNVSRINDNVSWNPIPVHTVANMNDILLGDGYVCKRYNELEDEIIHSSLTTKVILKYQSLFDFLTNMTKVRIPLNISNVWRIADTVKCERHHNVKQPFWLNDSIVTSLNWLQDFEFDLMFHKKEMKMLRCGMLLNNIREHMFQIVSKNESKPIRKIGSELIIYSGHDTDVACMLHALDIFNGVAPPYCSTVIFELHEVLKGNSDWFVRVLYHNSSEMPLKKNNDMVLPAPIPMKIPKCSSIECPLMEFMKITESLIEPSIDSFKEKCELKNKFSVFSINGYSHIVKLVIFLIIVVLLFIFILRVLFKIIFRRQHHHHHSSSNSISTDIEYTQVINHPEE